MATFNSLLWTQDGTVIRMEVIIGIDPGATSGWAALTVESNPRLLLVDSIKWPKPGTKKDLPANTPASVVESVISALGQSGHVVVGAAIEDQYLGLNPDTMKKLARNAGRWEEAFRRLGISVQWVNPQTWQTKELGTSRIGSAEVKRRCSMKVRGMWNVKVRQDAADAAIIGRYAAVRHAYRSMRKVGKKR